MVIVAHPKPLPKEITMLLRCEKAASKYTTFIFSDLEEASLQKKGRSEIFITYFHKVPRGKMRAKEIKAQTRCISLKITKK